MTVSAFLKLIRYKNLLVYALCLILVRTNIIDIFYAANGTESSISMIHYMIFVFAFILSLAGGYIINDYNDQSIDDINRLDKNIIAGNYIKSKTTKRLSLIFIVASFVISVFFVIISSASSLISTVILIFTALIYKNYNKLKKVFLGKNIFMSLIPVLLVLTPILMEQTKYYFDESLVAIKDKFWNIMPVVLWLAVALALVQFIREVVKDMQDREGDEKYGVKTLIIKYGEPKTKRIVCILTAVLMIFILVFQIMYFQISPFAMLGGVSILIHIPLIYFLVEFRKAGKVQDYGFLADLLSMIFISILFITFLTRSVVVWQITAGF